MVIIGDDVKTKKKKAVTGHLAPCEVMTYLPLYSSSEIFVLCGMVLLKAELNSGNVKLHGLRDKIVTIFMIGVSLDIISVNTDSHSEKLE